MWQLKLILYLLEVSLVLTAFFVVYKLLLKNLTFFKLNRIYLISAIILSFGIPSITIELQNNTADLPNANRIYEKAEDFTVISSRVIDDSDTSPITLINITFYFYTFIAAILLLRVLASAFTVCKYIRKTAKVVNGLKIIHKYSGFVNCSFFNYVFINPLSLSKREMEMLLHHEHVHAKQLHSADKILLLLCKVTLWFNPLIYLFEKEVELIHEFEADSFALNNVDTKEYTQFLIRLASDNNTNPLTLSFGKHPVKERIFMLFKDKSKASFRFTYMVAIPIILVLVTFFSTKFTSAYPHSSSTFTLILDPGHGGSDNGAIYGSTNEKELTLGLVKKIQSIAELRGLKVIVTRADDSNVSLQQRASNTGDLLLSIHHNTSPDKSKNGIEIMAGDLSALSTRNIVKGVTLNLYQNLRLLKGLRIANVYKEVTGIYLLKKSVAPSVMLEVGYLSNEKDRAFLLNPAYQNDLADAIVNSVLAYQAHIAH
jgi:N-acetylmuramoyl-L-alanine amidase